MHKRTPNAAASQTRAGVVPVKANGRTVAGVRGDVLQKDIHGSRHFLKRPYLAIAFDVAVLDEAERLGATIAEVCDLETGKLYRASIAAVRAGLKLDRGFGPQVALALSEWRRDAEPVAEQLALFG
jgi:hypothetical protein